MIKNNLSIFLSLPFFFSGCHFFFYPGSPLFSTFATIAEAHEWNNISDVCVRVCELLDTAFNVFIERRSMLRSLSPYFLLKLSLILGTQ